MQELHTTGSIKATVFATPFRGSSEVCDVELGQNIEQILGLDSPLEHNDILVIDKQEVIPKEEWATYFPDEKSDLTIAVLPKGGDIFRLVATLALSVFAGPAAGFLAAPLGITSATGLLLLEAGIRIAGTLLINALFSSPRDHSGEEPSDPEVFGISQIRNSLPTRRQPILTLYGEHRVYPFFAAQPYTSINAAGNMQFLNILFDLGYGPVEIVDNDLLKIGDRPFSEFSGLTWAFHEGMPSTDSRLMQFDRQYYTTRLSITLTEMSGWHEITTAPNINRTTINLFLAGLFQYSSQGNRQPRTVRVEYGSRPQGEMNWSATSALEITEETSQEVFRAISIDFTDLGQHQVRIRRVTEDADEGNIRDTISVYSLVSENPNYPVRAQGRALFALRIQATDQLSGVVDTFNGVFRRKTQTYINGAWDNTYVGTSSPAWAFADVLRGQGIYERVPDANIDGAAFLDWHEHCVRNGYRFDAIFDGRQSVWETLQDIAACGRAGPTLRDGYLHSIIIDRVKLVPVDLLTPRDLLDFKGEKAFADSPHALAITFRDSSDNLYQEKEIVVYDTGFNERTARDIRSIRVFGTTQVAQVHRRAKYTLANGRLRPEAFEVVMDIKHLAITRGDYVDLVHDGSLSGLGQGRVVRNVERGGMWIGFDVDDDIPQAADPTARLNARFQTFDGSRILAEVRRNQGHRPERSVSGRLQPT